MHLRSRIACLVIAAVFGLSASGMSNAALNSGSNLDGLTEPIVTVPGELGTLEFIAGKSKKPKDKCKSRKSKKSDKSKKSGKKSDKKSGKKKSGKKFVSDKPKGKDCPVSA